MVDQFLTGSVEPEGEVYLVTGSHGHIGSYIVEELTKQKDDITIVCVDNLYNGNVDNLQEAYSNTIVISSFCFVNSSTI
jgi:dTDP-D-glucose 4,6-dehydratase